MIPVGQRTIPGGSGKETLRHETAGPEKLCCGYTECGTRETGSVLSSAGVGEGACLRAVWERVFTDTLYSSQQMALPSQAIRDLIVLSLPESDPRSALAPHLRA